MKRKRPGKRVTGKKKISRSKQPAWADLTALVKSDAETFRNQIKKDYEKSQRDLSKAREQLEAFRTRDAPAFVRWLHQTFGRHLTEIREISREVAEADLLVHEVENEAFYNDISYARAYRRVMCARQRAARRPPPGQEEEDPDLEFDEGMDDFLNSFEEFLGEDPEQAPGNSSRRGSKPHSSGEEIPVTTPQSSRLKQLYRTLVRRLHPDKHERVDPRKQECWHQVQAAYQAGDEEQLEIILALCEIDQEGHADSTSMGLLQRITRQFKKALREIRSQLRKLKSDPAWNFSNRRDRHVVEGQVRWRLEAELDNLKVRLHELNRIIRHWKNSR